MPRTTHSEIARRLPRTSRGRFALVVVLDSDSDDESNPTPTTRHSPLRRSGEVPVHHSRRQPRTARDDSDGPTTRQPPTTRKRLQRESNLTPSSGSSSSLTPSSPNVPQQIPAVVEVPLSPPPPSMENRDSFTRSPAPSYAPATRAVKGIAVPTGGDPPDFRQRAFGPMQQSPKPTRVLVEPADKVGASTSVAKDPEQKVTKEIDERVMDAYITVVSQDSTSMTYAEKKERVAAMKCLRKVIFRDIV